MPNAFYRHFRNTDELGLALVEEVGVTLRRLLREARQTGPGGAGDGDVVRRSVQDSGFKLLVVNSATMPSHLIETRARRAVQIFLRGVTKGA